MGTELVAAIPAFNCARAIGGVVRGCLRHLPAVYVVDDGSQDDTAKIASEAGARVETLAANRGKGFALRRAIDNALVAEPPAVLLLDGDGQHSPDDIPGFLDAWRRQDADLWIGSRMAEAEKIPRSRYWTNHLGSRVLSYMTGYDLEDSQSGFRLLRSSLLRRLKLCSDGYAIESEMLIKAAKLSARVAHIPIQTIYEGAESHFHPLLDTLRISWASTYFQVFCDL